MDTTDPDDNAFPVRVWLVDGIRQHPHAEHLTLVKLRGHGRELVADKNEDGSFRYTAGHSLVEFFPTNAILPRAVLERIHCWDHEKGKGTLGGNRKDRVQSRKFADPNGSEERYESRGMLRPCEFATRDGEPVWWVETPGGELDVVEGTVTQEALGITQHVPQ